MLQVYSEDGVAVLMDIGSSVMTAEMALELLSRPKLKLFDCPLVEGAVIAAVESNMGSSLEEIEQRTVAARSMRKLN